MRVRVINPDGIFEAEALVILRPINLLKEVDPVTGKLAGAPDIREESISGKILMFPHGKGSTVGSYLLYALKRNGTSPLAIINERFDLVIASGCIFSSIPYADQANIRQFKTGDRVRFDTKKGELIKV